MIFPYFDKFLSLNVIFSLVARPLPPPPLNGPAFSGGFFFCGFPYNNIFQGEGNGGARGGGEDEYGEEGRKGGVDWIIKAASYIDKEEQIKGKDDKKHISIFFAQ